MLWQSFIESVCGLGHWLGGLYVIPPILAIFTIEPALAVSVREAQENLEIVFQRLHQALNGRTPEYLVFEMVLSSADVIRKVGEAMDF